MRQLTGQDAMFIHAELQGLPQHFGIMAIYDQATAQGGLVRFKQILQLLQQRLHLSPIFTQRLRKVPMNLDQPWWESAGEIDIERHVHHLALPKPGDWRQLCILASRLHARPMDMNLPLWEIYVIEGLDKVKNLPKGCFALLIKVHHAAMDGATGAQFIPLLHDLSAEINQLPAGPTPAKEHISNRKLLGAALLNNLRKPAQLWNFGKEMIPSALRLYQGRKDGDFQKLEDKQETLFQGKISPHRVCDALPFDFADIRAIKNTCEGATINDVMLTIISGAMRHYLESRQAMPKENLVAGCPIDVRNDQEADAGGNMVGFMTVSLHSAIQDPKDRLEAIHQASMESKSFANALGPRVTMKVTDVLPGGMLSLALRAATSTGLAESAVIFNTIVTNVPGPQEQLYFCGAKLVDFMALGPLLPNVGLFHIVYSSVLDKKGSISVSFTACRQMMPDPAFYAQCLQRSFDELKAATLK
ncbi:wax ester/triacylglycerol synthase family O-acyltransferase [Spongiibacter sp. KMU-158]|uniref:diacylglycerol O-acyltransferase n=1 Tax=Spongiibacter pelagi TaxID=2760804 RepID=A0A927BYR6_9GAMM|nr:wax ester/triacylglycerol synthase family O-acyltransferase [Spongiibacter pelagi]MBD2858043.1 wax ester/triacylglycerol synthase family O-acyltransferase [Spongiibacter pelagi]